MKVSVVIPTLNEEGSIRDVLNDVKGIMGRRPDYEIIVVDGCSKDRTVEIAKDCGATVIFENLGKGYALRKGMEHSKGDVVITMDADHSHDPKEMDMLITGIGNGYDICMGSRFMKGGGTEDMPWHRKIGNRFFTFFINAVWRTEYTDLCYGYRSFRRDVVKDMKLKSNGFSIETEISIKAAKMGLRVLEIPSFEKPRKKGEGKLKTFSDGIKVARIILKELGSRD